MQIQAIASHASLEDNLPIRFGAPPYEVGPHQNHIVYVRPLLRIYGAVPPIEIDSLVHPLIIDGDLWHPYT